jgi:hypothetical protein
MRKIYLLLSFSFLFAALAKAQQPPIMIDPVKDKKEISGYTIQLKMAPRNTVLFEIMQQGKPVYMHPMNPVSMLPEGFDTKEDAFKVAEWMIREYGKQPHFPPMVPPHVVRELKIKDPLTQRTPQY